VRENWRWRVRDRTYIVSQESSSFTLFLNCLADARAHGFDIAAHEFVVISE
jgi:hypothetical protein